MLHFCLGISWVCYIFNPEIKKSLNNFNAWLISVEFSPDEKVHGEDFSGGRRYSASVVFRERHQGLWQPQCDCKIGGDGDLMAVT